MDYKPTVGNRLPFQRNLNRTTTCCVDVYTGQFKRFRNLKASSQRFRGGRRASVSFGLRTQNLGVRGHQQMQRFKTSRPHPAASICVRRLSPLPADANRVRIQLLCGKLTAMQHHVHFMHRKSRRGSPKLKGHVFSSYAHACSQLVCVPSLVLLWRLRVTAVV